MPELKHTEITGDPKREESASPSRYTGSQTIKHIIQDGKITLESFRTALNKAVSQEEIIQAFKELLRSEYGKDKAVAIQLWKEFNALSEKQTVAVHFHLPESGPVLDMVNMGRLAGPVPQSLLAGGNNGTEDDEDGDEDGGGEEDRSG